MEKFTRQLHKQQFCEKCYFWERDSNRGEMYGDCYRYPELKEKNSVDWCGEFKKNE